MFLELSGIDSSSWLVGADGTSFSRAQSHDRRRITVLLPIKIAIILAVFIVIKGKMLLFCLQFSLWFLHHGNQVSVHLRGI